VQPAPPGRGRLGSSPAVTRGGTRENLANVRSLPPCSPSCDGAAPRPPRAGTITTSRPSRRLDPACPLPQDAAVVEAPEVRYTRNGDVSLAFQIVGEGPVDVVEMTGMFTHLEAKWEEPGLVRSTTDIARFARVVLYDRRGIGLSDRLPADTAPSLDEHVSDTCTVLDAAGSDAAIVLGIADGAGIAVSFAAAYPERTRGLILYNPAPLAGQNEAFAGRIDELVAVLEREWGTGVMSTWMGGGEDTRSWFSRGEGRASTPRAAATMLRMQMLTDLSLLLPAIRVPTLVMHYADHPGLPVAAARRLAASIPGARFVELSGYSPLVQVRERKGLATAIEEFVTGSVSVADDDRVLAAVLFTDIVGSTARAAEIGDQRWRDVLDEYDQRVRGTVQTAGGRVVKTTGDGVLARFGGASRAVRCAEALIAEAKRLGLAVRAGVHVGECELRGDDIAGLTVHVTARVMAMAGPNEIYATSTVREALAGSGIAFEQRGSEALRGVPGTWAVFVVTRRDDVAVS
jgi:class 3 adenylate cyclase